jgi:hypothetical protein
MTALEYLENWLKENYIVIGVDFVHDRPVRFQVPVCKLCCVRC